MSTSTTNELERDSAMAEAAEALRAAEATQTPCPPVRNILGPHADLDAAYKIQQANTDAHTADGRRVSGRKIGLTSAAVQAQLGVNQPDFGTLFVDMEHGDGADVDPSSLLQPRAEAEIALVLERDLDRAPHGFAEIIRATAFALPAIEIVDSRVAGWDITIIDTVADNASCGRYVLGSRPTPLSAIADLRAIEMQMRCNDAVVSTGTGSACLGNPLLAARWLADTLCERGTPLQAGDVVMTGALGPMQAVSDGDVLVAHLSGLGSVSVRLGRSG